MARHWSDAYVGRRYVRGQYDCAALAADVQQEVFGRAVDLPAERPHDLRAQAAAVAGVMVQHAEPVERAVEGCLALLRKGPAARPWHVGVYFERGGEGWILHATASSGQAISTRVRALHLLGYQIEGYYQWV